MKLTIINSDKAVYKDKLSYSDLNLTTMPSNIHALQWDSDANVGWIEYNANPDGTKTESNLVINELPSWANDALTEWDNADIAAKAQAAQFEAQLAQQEAQSSQQQSNQTSATQAP